MASDEEYLALCRRVHGQAHKLAGTLMAIERQAGSNELAAKMAKQAGLQALALCSEMVGRVREMELRDDQSDGYDLATLSTLPMEARELDDAPE